MQAVRLVQYAVLMAAVACAPREAEEQADASQDPAPAAEPMWAAAPGLPPGAEMQVMSGDPSQPGEFVVQLRFPNDYRVPPHTHPAVETVTIVSGTLHVGMGETYDLSGNIDEMTPGESATVAAGQPHFAHAAGETVIEVRSTGPFRIDYVNPADAPPGT